MARTRVRLRIAEDGELEIVDPGFDTLSLLQEIKPDFRVEETPGVATEPAFLALRSSSAGLAEATLAAKSEHALWDLHRSVMARAADTRTACAPAIGEASILRLKRELAHRFLARCRLCAHRCGVDRTAGELGVCRLGQQAVVAEHFVHIAEEAPVNPSLVLALAGCGLRCRYCQQGALLEPAAVSGEPLDASLWQQLDGARARTMSFVGGNPDESLPAILRFLEAAPDWWHLPIVWNSHAYGTPEVLALLEGVVDVYLPDCKYGNNACARRWSATGDYVSTAHAAIAIMSAQTKTIVRILVLPGHVECCHLPSLEYLAALRRDRVVVSIRGQYCPDWRITARHGAMSRRPSTDEVTAVYRRASALGLNLV